MKSFFRAVFKLVGIAGMGIAAYVMINWYIQWISYYFIGNLKPSIIVGLVTFFLSPLAGIADLFWHSFAKPTVEMWIYFLVYFICGRFAFFIGEKLNDKY
jgi:hypothetical protein